jgi:hypothetical protein
MNNQNFRKLIETIRSNFAIKDSKYWTVTLQDGESAVDNKHFNICITTYDGYNITIKPVFIARHRGCMNGYVQIPYYTHLSEWVQNNPSYDDMNYSTDLPVELTFFDELEQTFGWDHMHSYDADLLKSEAEQPEELVSGPVQVLEEARKVIAKFREKDDEIKMKLKQAHVDHIREELMMKTCHPRRIGVWVAQGFDPFP